jgi:O-antigen/teichoic acid export membrane protein
MVCLEVSNSHNDVRRLVKDGGLLFAVVTAANLSNYLFHVIMTRLLGPSDYGALGALLAVVLVLSVPTGALQAVIARRAAVLDGDADALGRLVRGSLKLTAAAGVVLGIAITGAAPWGRTFFHVSSIVPLLFVAAFMVPTAVSPVGLGALQGTHRFRTLGASLAVAMVVKLALGVALVQMGFGISGAVAGVAAGGMAGLAVAMWPFRALLPGSVTGFEVSPIARETARAGMAFLAYWTLVSVDLLLVRHYHPGAVSGRYAAASLLGRAVLFLPAAVSIVVYPRFAARPGSPESRRLLLGSVGIVGALGGVVSLGVLVFPDLVATLFGRDYLGVGSVGPILTFAMTAFGLVSLLLYYGLAAARPPVKTLWIATVLQTAAIVAVSDSPRAVAWVVMAVGIFLASWLGAHAFRATRRVQVAAGELWEKQPAFNLDLSVVTPSFNGAGHIATTLTSLREALAETGLRTEIILVSDGSRDGTADVAATNGDGNLRVLHYEQNEGKGYALRTGLARARGEFIAFIDSDGDLDPHELSRFIELMRLYKADLVVGSKRHPLSEVSYPWPRRVMSWAYHVLVRVLFGLKISDTQTGLKLVRRDVLANVLPRLVEKRFAFDLELLVAARRLGYRRIIEAPVRLDYKFASTISGRAVRGILQDTAAVWYRRYVVLQYDSEPAAEMSPEPAVSRVL